MGNYSPVDVILIKDGAHFYLRPLGIQPIVRIAFLDLSENNPSGAGRLRTIVPGTPSNEEINKFLDKAAEDIEGYMSSGDFDRDRAITHTPPSNK